MALMVLDPRIEQRLKAEREASGLNRYDEVWDGVYMIRTPSDLEHQDLLTGMSYAVRMALTMDHPAHVHAANVSDRDEDWLENYRTPDVAVVYPESTARNCDTHWCGGPDFCAEIASPGDRS